VPHGVDKDVGCAPSTTILGQPQSTQPPPSSQCCCAYLLYLAMHHLFVYMLIQDANSFAITSCATYVFVRLGAPLGVAYVRTRHARGERIRASVAKLF